MRDVQTVGHDAGRAARLSCAKSGLNSRDAPSSPSSRVWVWGFSRRVRERGDAPVPRSRDRGVLHLPRPAYRAAAPAGVGDGRTGWSARSAIVAVMAVMFTISLTDE